MKQLNMCRNRKNMSKRSSAVLHQKSTTNHSINGNALISFSSFKFKHCKRCWLQTTHLIRPSLAFDWHFRVNEPPGTEGRPITTSQVSVFSILATSLGAPVSSAFLSPIQHGIRSHVSRKTPGPTISLSLDPI